MAEHDTSFDFHAAVGDILSLNPHLSDDQFIQSIEKLVFQQGRHLLAREKAHVVQSLFFSYRGLDVLQPLMDDPTITEIMVNQYDAIFIERDGMMMRTSCKFASQAKLEDVIQMMVAQMNRAVNEYSPLVDARWNERVRIHVALPPVSLNGPVLTIRKFPQYALTMEQLEKGGCVTSEVSTFLKSMVRNGFNMLISGGTSSGKTTFLNALTQWIPSTERVISIEDCAELHLSTIENVIRLETRNANAEGKGAVSTSDLIRAALRMRPTRIIVGEVRGGEAFDMLQAMNTGHDGSISTAHANSTSDMLNRLEGMVISAVRYPLEAIRRQIYSAIDIFIHLARVGTERKLIEISGLTWSAEGQLCVRPIYHEQHGFAADAEQLLTQKRVRIMSAT
jgi:pilus assembly protein CpaF